MIGMGIIAEAIISSPPDFLPSLLVVLGLLTGRSDSGPWINKNKALRRLRVSAVEVFFPAPTLWALGPLKNVGAPLELPGPPLPVFQRTERWGAAFACPGDPCSVPWVGLACWSWCCGAGFETGWGCREGQVLSHLAAGPPSPTISRPVRSASVGRPVY